MALQERAHERADREHRRAPASEVIEHAADELRPYPSPLVRGVDLGVKHGDEAGLKVIVRIASERGADVPRVPPALRVVTNRDLVDPVWSGSWSPLVSRSLAVRLRVVHHQGRAMSLVRDALADAADGADAVDAA